jgi:hypothetical protein
MHSIETISAGAVVHCRGREYLLGTPQPFDRKVPSAVVRLEHDGERWRADIG